MRPTPGNDLILGHLAGRDATLTLRKESRDKHLYVCGGTGTGKSKLFENLIRQDIQNWRKTKCGLILFDPHGSLYDSLIRWLAKHRLERPIIPIDVRQDDWIVSYNLLRRRNTADPAVIVDNLVDAMAYVWGQQGTDQTPLFARWASNVIRTLYEKNQTLIESDHLTDRVERRLRQAMIEGLKDKASRQDWEFANTLNPKEFEAQIGSTVSRLQRFVRNDKMRCILGQRGASLDLGAALDEGSIILVSLATEKAKVSKENAELFATLLLSDLWTAAQERGKRKGVKPFYVYIDEFQRFVTPTISENLDEARGFGLHLTMAHQFPNQLLDRGPDGRRVFNSIMENASSKVVFRLTHEDNLRLLAQWLFMGIMDPDEVKHSLYSTKVMEYREEYRTVYSRGSGHSRGGGAFSGRASEEGFGGEISPGGEFNTQSWRKGISESSGQSASWSESATESESLVPTLIPILGKELSHVQFRSLDEQLFRAMAILFDQAERQCVARLVGTRAPVSLFTPTVKEIHIAPERVRAYLETCFQALPSALRIEEARKRLREREAHFVKEIFRTVMDEPATAKRRTR